MFSWGGALKWGRCNRRGYWISLGVLFVLMVMGVTLVPLPDGIMRLLGITWIVIWVLRLHDTGRSGWYALIPLAGTMLITIAALMLLGSNLALAFEDDETLLADPKYALGTIGVVGICLLIQVIFSVWIGIKPGDDGPNKFGPAPS